MSSPDFVGISVWRGRFIASKGKWASSGQYSGHNVRTDGQWSDLSKVDWDLLKERDLENLVSLRRFAVQ